MTAGQASYADVAQALEELPTALRVTRRSRHLSLREAADQISVNFSTLTRIERGENHYSIKAAIRIMRWLDASVGGEQP
jgi:transcriptional regulator with XRE-family HTH domain